MNKINKYVLVSLIIVISGIFGFIYESIFYYFDLGYFVKRGSTFGSWIPIYAIWRFDGGCPVLCQNGDGTWYCCS